ncbi:MULTISPECIES: hypothetical protein [unclassified Pedobacter]|uniref:hypothetical protein n=1 Tax=unclassified Pedobacter TaxID=2628915 RepID=UPI000B4C0871|nr:MULTISPECIES: hypothetical protein [unclassified Pedobacter]MCX2433114.1 hypothetical protein [Pedobacter sp. GR22-10]MCX2586119.1 hypothetical protein [Pedobacter sp. MR22-3]OWK69469.1 hypothetical protein CBW18_16785 [Pedobacter sp. AJM]
MKHASAIHFNNQTVFTDATFNIAPLKLSVMKKLANTSPFLLLLLPVFMMMILTLTVNTNPNEAEIVVKPAKASTSVVKQATAIFK